MGWDFFFFLVDGVGSVGCDLPHESYRDEPILLINNAEGEGLLGGLLGILII